MYCGTLQLFDTIDCIIPKVNVSPNTILGYISYFFFFWYSHWVLKAIKAFSKFMTDLKLKEILKKYSVTLKIIDSQWEFNASKELTVNIKTVYFSTSN